MKGTWNETSLGNLVEFQSGGTPFKGNAAFWNGSIPWVSAKDMKQFFLDDTEDHITTAAADDGAKQVPAGTVLMLTRGMTLLNDVPICIVRRPMSFNQDVKALRPRGELDGRFLPYLLLGNKHRLLGMVDLAGHGTGRLNTEELKTLNVVLPHPSEQQAIACILGALDDKIELNRRRNRTLEAMARAIFQSWFVDFDPVKAKAAGRKPAGLSKEIAALFPASFEDSPLGEIPKGWRACQWGDIATLEYGKSLRDYAEADGVFRVYGTNGPIGWHTETLCDGPGIVIGRKGAYRGIHYSPRPFFVIDTAFYLKPRQPIDVKWAYYELLKCDINSMDSGSAIPSTSRADFYAIPVCLPPPGVLKAFGELTQPIYDRRDESDKENVTLAALRDALLPKLISGELRVPDAERIVGRAV